MIRVLSVEDDTAVQTYLVARLELEPDIRVEGRVATAAAACAYLRRHEADLILLDYGLGGADGLQLLQAISLWFEEMPAEHRRPAVLFCTASASNAFEEQARALGADGVVGKDCLLAELVPAVRAVAAGENWFGHGADRERCSTRRGRVLVATYDRTLRTHISEALTHLRCTATHAWRSDEIPAMLEAEPFDLLLLEDRIPGRLRSTELLERLLDHHPALPVLFLAGVPAGMGFHLPPANVRAVVSTPVSVPQLREEVARALALIPQPA